MAKIDFIRGDSVVINLDLDVDLTGATVFFTAKNNITDSDANAVLTKEQTDHVDAAAGTTTIEFTPEETAAISLGTAKSKRLFYDIQVKHQDGSIESWPMQRLKVRADITKRTS